MRSVFVALLVVIGAAACGKNTEPPPPSSGSPNAPPESGPSKPRTPSGTDTAGTTAAAADGISAKAREIFGTRCAMCHGTDGTGNGPAAANLNPKPRNYTDAAWQASVTDEELAKTIVKGGQAVGKSMMMPGNPDLESDPETVTGLVKIIRGFKK